MAVTAVVAATQLPLGLSPIGRLVFAGLLLVLALASITMVWLHVRGRVTERLVTVPLVGLIGGGVLTLVVAVAGLGGKPVAASVAVLALLVAVVCALVLPGARGWLGWMAVMATSAGVVIARLPGFRGRIDVEFLLDDAIAAMLSGTSPYAITVANIYDAHESSVVYGPGVLQDDRVGFGYPYLPAPLLLDTPAYLLGDVRWMHLFAMAITSAVAFHLASDVIGRLAALALAVSPQSAALVSWFWVEPVIIALLALTVWSWSRGARWMFVPLGLFFASKQYAVSYLPALWSVLRDRGLRALVAAGILGSVLVGVFLAWNPHAFVRSVVEFHLKQPFREDALSLLPGLTQIFGPLPSWLQGVSVLVGFATSILIAWRTKPGPTAFALGVGLSLLVTIVLSKTAFLNYFAVAAAAMLLAVVTWPADDPLDVGHASTDDAEEPQTREPSSQGSRGPRGIVSTR